MRLRLRLIASIYFAFLSTAEALSIPEAYLSGVEVCAKNLDSRQNELGRWIKVPIDYSSLPRGTTDLYTWTKKPYDAQKKTVVFVSGGPGDTAHSSSLDLNEWNIIFFDQRGNSCSRPATKELYLDRSFYSSEKTARDIEEIRKAYAADTISVYGVSYGTVPAHLYGHFFPQTTRAVALEGVVYEGGSRLIQPARRTKILQRFFDSLPEKIQNRILELSTHPEVAPTWFSSAGMMMLYLDDPLGSYLHFLNNILWNDDVAIGVLKSFEKSNSEEDVEYGFGHVMMGMIGCQELGMNLPGLSFYSVFQNRRLVSDGKNHFIDSYCRSLGFTESAISKIYKATDYPTQTPTTYIQGALDGATSANNAVDHFKNVANGFAQLILVREGGHMPLHGPLTSGYEQGAPIEARKDILNKILQGHSLEGEDLQKINKATTMQWTRSLRERQRKIP